MSFTINADPVEPMNYFPDKLQLEDDGIWAGSRVFMLMRRFRYVSSFGVIDVPLGTLTDGASVPRMFWPVFDPWGPYLGAAVIHDFLYSRANTEFTRDEADYIFHEAMYNIGVPWHTRNTIFMAVRLFGGKSFKGT